MNHNINKSSWHQRIVLILIITLIVFIAGCSFQSTFDYPEISYIDKSNVISKTPEQATFPTISTGTLKVALPLSDECLRYLSLIYVGKTQGLLKEDISDNNGLNVSLEMLDSFETGLNVVLQPVSSTGITDQELQALSLSNALPDIMLISDKNKLSSNQITMAKFDNSTITQYISPDNIFPSMIQNGLSRSSLLSLPYYAAVKMLYANDLVTTDVSNNSLLPASSRIDFVTMQTIAKKITNPQTGTYGFMGLSEMLAFLPMTFESSVSGYMWNGVRYDFSNKAFSNSITNLKTLISSGCVVDSLNSNQKKVQYNEIDPRILNKIGFWIDDSNQLESWKLLGQSKIKRYPIQGESQITIPLTIYSVVVNSNCLLIDDAKRFASFLALDKDALLFRSRYINPNGFIPPLRDKSIWENLVNTQLQGNEMFSLYENMDLAKSVTNFDDNTIKTKYEQLYNEYFNDVLYGRKSLPTFLEEINTEANTAIS